MYLLYKFYIDDMNLLMMVESHQESLHHLVQCTQQSVTAWQGSLHATGSALKPGKCMWSLVSYAWVNGKWHYHKHPADLQVNDLDGTPIMIACYDSSTAIKIVGIYQAMDGNMKVQLQHLKDKSRDWGTKIKEGWVPQKLANQGLHSMLLASLKYPLPATTFTESQGAKLSDSLFYQLLPKLGAVRYYPKVYRYAPAELQDLALPHAKVEQEIYHIQRILTHGSINTVTGHWL